jgi:hypothetical protein
MPLGEHWRAIALAKSAGGMSTSPPAALRTASTI